MGKDEEVKYGHLAVFRIAERGKVEKRQGSRGGRD